LTAVDADRLTDLLAASRQRKINLQLPKLHLRTQAELTPALSTLGVHTVFTNDADLSGISEDPLAVQAVLHESVLKVEEEGLEGAAATAVMMRLLSFDPERPVEVVVDRPFLLLVRHAQSGAVYFSARVTDPS
jgi:serine protease inhibitor